MALFEEAPSRSGSRAVKLSSNMFFARNTAVPKRVRHIEGLNGQLICNVNDDPSLIRSASTSILNFNKTNLPSLESSRRVERLVPPMGFWTTHGIIHDTERWKQELATLANASGLGLERDNQSHHKKPTATADSQHASRSGAHYSTQTGRFNEGTARSRGRTGSKHSTAYSDMVFNLPENEREMWMLQVLCQLIGTSNLEDVQSWLISATHTEKEQARTMINSALRGLKESDRTSNQSQQPIDLDSLSDFVDKRKTEERYASEKYMKDSLNRSAHVLQSINEESQTDTSSNDPLINSALKKYSTLPLINTTTYQLSYPNYGQSPSSSLEAITSNNRNNSSNETHQYKGEHGEHIETLQLDEYSPRAQSPSFANTKKQSNRFESFQLTDDDDNGMENKRKATIFPSIKHYESYNDDGDDDPKTRRIRDLQNKLSRQEEDAQKQINELQSKQSRLENALKLIVKQTSYGKRHQQTHDDNDKNVDGPVGNLESQKENNRHHSEEVHSQKSSTTNKNRDDNRSTKSFAGVWKPDASVLHRLQGN